MTGVPSKFGKCVECSTHLGAASAALGFWPSQQGENCRLG
jgi:hypothetical protein